MVGFHVVVSVEVDWTFQESVEERITQNVGALVEFFDPRFWVEFIFVDGVV